MELVDYFDLLRSLIFDYDQSCWLRDREDAGFKCVVSNDYDHVVKVIDSYMTGVRLSSRHCPKRKWYFTTQATLNSHIKSFHKMKIVESRIANQSHQ